MGGVAKNSDLFLSLFLEFRNESAGALRRLLSLGGSAAAWMRYCWRSQPAA